MTLTTFTSGTKAKASEVNANFQDLDERINVLGEDYTNFIQKDGSVDFTEAQSYAKHTITGASNATPIVITSTAHGRTNGQTVLIKDVAGNTAANGQWVIANKTANTYELVGSTGNSAYTSGGTGYLIPQNDENLLNMAYVNTHSVLPRVTCSTAAATAEKVLTVGGETLVDGLTYLVTMTNANTASNPTFNLNSGTAHALVDKRGNVVGLSNKAGEKILISYDSANAKWVLISAEFYDSRMSTPSTTYIDLTIGASGAVYTAPTNGYLSFIGVGYNGYSLWFHNNANGMQTSCMPYSVSTNVEISVYIPVQAGQVITYGWLGSPTDKVLRFHYAEGSKP
jgi:hypothetical protein